MRDEIVWHYSLLSQDRHDGQDGRIVTLRDEDGGPVAISFATEDKARAFQATIDAIRDERGPAEYTVRLSVGEDT